MKVGILGTGDVGRTLGGGFLGLGDKVKMGSRNPARNKIQDWVSKGAICSDTVKRLVRVSKAS